MAIFKTFCLERWSSYVHHWLSLLKEIYFMFCVPSVYSVSTISFMEEKAYRYAFNELYIFIKTCSVPKC